MDKFCKKGEVNNAVVEVQFKDGEPSKVMDASIDDIQYHDENGNAFVQVTLALPINKNEGQPMGVISFTDNNGNEMSLYARKVS